ncbi:hypothetical protein XENOCAPTIV_012757 [Xenoophorus captivus]|uniref:Uncharacterized protein n=1 Tax=Xenoophorus captivus TaxID=1517983 RepID=A0ABV0QRH4_9TELE
MRVPSRNDINAEMSTFPSTVTASCYQTKQPLQKRQADNERRCSEQLESTSVKKKITNSNYQESFELNMLFNKGIQGLQHISKEKTAKLVRSNKPLKTETS